MADPLLTSLCSICHTSEPKYKCPRCGIQTCSLPCIKKHKAWASCSGTRDVTAYRPRKDLCTASGIDHDYNFIHGIERNIERSEKELVDEKALLKREELRPPTIKEVKWKHGRDGRKRKVLVTRIVREPRSRTFERFLAGALRRHNIVITCAPTGMQRQQENATTYNRRSGRINWQVEWLTFSGHDAGANRALHKVMDDVPLYKAYLAVLEETKKKTGQGREQPARLGRGPAQVAPSTAWVITMDCIQDPLTETWASFERDVELWPTERDEEQRNKYSFYLAKHGTRADEGKIVTALAPQYTLRSILTDSSVLEFPTIYVLRAGEKLPVGFTLGPKNAIPRQQQPGDKRQMEGTDDKSSSGPRSTKKTKTKMKGWDMEEGEVDEKDGGKVAEGKDEDSDPAEVIDEQSYDEDEGDGGDDRTSDTSSSGTDSDADEEEEL